MENNKEDLIVVLAGYKDKMDKFYSYIPARRPPAACTLPSSPLRSTLPRLATTLPCRQLPGRGRARV